MSVEDESPPRKQPDPSAGEPDAAPQDVSSGEEDFARMLEESLAPQTFRVGETV